MRNELTDLIDEVAELNAKKPASVPLLPPTAPDGAPPPEPETPETSDPPQRLGPPRFIAIALEQNYVHSNIGDFTLDEKEFKEIITICLRALARSMRLTFADVAKTHGIEPPKRTGLTIMATELTKAEGDEPSTA